MEASVNTEDADPSERGLARGAVVANIGGALGNVWTTYAAPNSVLLLLFVSEWLHGAKWHIGLILALTNLGPTLEPLGAWLMERRGCRKRLFLVTHLCQRLPFFALAAIPLMEPTTANRGLGLIMVFAIVAVTRIACHLGSAAWWSWMGDLVPAERRSHWLGCRFQCASGVMALSFLAASLLLHHCGGMENRALVSGLFAAGALFGVVDILLYFWVPEVPMRVRRPCHGWQDFTARARQPFQRPIFRRFLLGLGLWLFAVNLVTPFIPLYLKGDTVGGQWVGLGVSWTFLAAYQALAQVGTMLSSRWWGRWCPRIGAGQLIYIGAGHLFVLVVLLGVGPRHYHAWLLTASLSSGVLLGAWQVGSQQLLFELAPLKNRGFYTSAYNMTNGWFIAAGSLLGGLLAGWMPVMKWTLPSGLPFAYLHMLLVGGLVAGIAALAVLLRVAKPDFSIVAIAQVYWQREVGRVATNLRLAIPPDRKAADSVERRAA